MTMNRPGRALSPSPSSSSRSASPTSSIPPPSPIPSDSGLPSDLASSTFLRTAQTLEELSRELSVLNDGDDADSGCCCGKRECPCLAGRERMEQKLGLSGEIGNALLQRCEALEKQHTYEPKRYQYQLEVKRKALIDSVKKVATLEKANTTGLNQYAELNRKNEALEKRYTQSLHTQTLTQQSLTHVRAELTTLRNTMQRQSIALASGAGVEDRLLDAEKRYEEAKELQLAAERNIRDETRRRKKAEARVIELDGLWRACQGEIEEIKDARAKDAQALLDNAKARLEELHKDLSETFKKDSEGDVPEYQKAMEDLVASNAILRHDASELTHLLAESKDEIRVLKEEVEELKGQTGRVSPSGIPPHLAYEIDKSTSYHARTGSSPINAGHDGSGWSRMSVSSSSRWDHNRRVSLAPSFTSTSTTEGVTSPGLGLGTVGEFSGTLVRDRAMSPPLSDGRESPRQGTFRTSPSGSLGYVLNGVPKTGAPRPQFRRRTSDRPAAASRYVNHGVDPIFEHAPTESDIGGHTTDEPLSPASEYFRAADISRKRRSLMLARQSSISPHDSTDLTSLASQTLIDPSPDDIESARSESEAVHTLSRTRNSPAKKVHRRTLLLLTKSVGTQTESKEEANDQGTVRMANPPKIPWQTAAASNVSSPIPEEHSETSSIHQSAPGSLQALVDHLSRLLMRLKAADIGELNRRLRKQHLPGDVAHLSRSTLRALITEIGDTKHQFRHILDSTSIQRREWNLLFKLLRDVFTELVDLQAIINDVTVEPKLAKRLHKDAYRDEEAEAAAAANGGSGAGSGGLGWIANPITRLFVTPAAEPAEEPKIGNRVERGRLQPTTVPVKAAPKQAAIAGATTTHVSVEFGGTGIVRRSTPATATSSKPLGSGTSGIVDTLPASPNPGYLDERAREPSGGSVALDASTVGRSDDARVPSGLRPPGMLRSSKSRANRNELLGIFAGAPKPPSPAGSQPWVVVDDGNRLGGPSTSRLRGASSQYFGSQNESTIRARDPIARPKLSAAVDAVIDQPSEQQEGVEQESSFQPLLERTLRPRGLSDSSIRSTFVSHAATADMAGAPVDTGPATRQTGYTGYGGSLLAGIGRRLYWSKGEVSPINPPPNDEPPQHPSTEDSPSPKKEAVVEPPPLSSSPSVPIAVTPKPTRTVSSGHPTHPGSQAGTSSGLLGFIASSLGGADTLTLVNDSDDEGRSPGRAGLSRVERDELSAAGLRHGVMPGRSSSRAGRRWD